ncbi:MAG: ABC transporter permease [bacterium]|nr:ABC transporter permease [bacterium]
MSKIMRLALREYKAAVKTKAFIISLILFPVLMGGSILAMALLQDKVDTTDRKVVILDHSGVIGERLVAEAIARNDQFVLNEEGEKVQPAYLLEVETISEDLDAQKLALSDQVRSRELHAFLEIGPDVLNPAVADSMGGFIRYHAENAVMDAVRRWVGSPLNSLIRIDRLDAFGIEDERAAEIFSRRDVDGMGLLSINAEGGVTAAEEADEGRAIGVPFAMAMLMFMMLMTGAIPLLSSVMEEKTARIAEVLLASISPFEFMMGKVVGGVAVSLTSMLIYLGMGSMLMSGTNFSAYIPYAIFPWFAAYTVLAIIMFGSMLAAIGAACNDPKEAQSLTMPAMMPMMIPMFVLMPVLQEPMGAFATVMSLIPPFTPMLMILRQATPMTIPLWQPWIGLVGVALFAVLSVWAGGRIFRVGILMQGQPPKLGEMVKWIFKG